jgi:hypothetical protein
MNEEQEPRQQFDEAVTAKRNNSLIVRTGCSEQQDSRFDLQPKYRDALQQTYSLSDFWADVHP